MAILTLVLPDTVRAEDDEETTFEQSIIRGLLGGGGKAPLDYRERSPLVIPPSNSTLPPPEAAAGVGNPAWPNDPDRRRQGGKGPGYAKDTDREAGRNLRPDELRRGAVRETRDGKPALTQSDNDQGRPMRPAELGNNRTLFGMFGGSADKAETETFKGEPVRSRMTEPPPGYRTPSAAQPYREPKDAPGTWYRAINPFDRGTQ